MMHQRQSSKKEKLRTTQLLVITAILWSLGGLLIKLIQAHPLAIAGGRSLIAALVLLIFIKKPKINWSFAQIGAALSYAGTVILFVTANKTTTAANAILLQFTAPVYVILLSAWLLKEKPLAIDWVTVVIVMCGITLFFMDDISLEGNLGNLIALASGVSFGLFAIFMRMQKDGSPVESVLLGNIITAFIGIPFIINAIPTLSGWGYLLILGVVQLAIPYILYAKAIKHATAIDAIIIPIIEPILNPIWVLLIVGEVPGRMGIIGGLIVLITITVRCTYSSRQNRKKRKSLIVE